MQALFMSTKFIAYAVILYCLWIFVSPIALQIKIRRRRSKYQYQEDNKRKTLKKQDALIQHLEKILTIIRNEVTSTTVLNFIALMVILFGTSFALFYSWFGLVYSLIISLMIGGIPYIIARLMVINIQSRTSLSLLQNFDIILSNYQTTKDIYYTFLYSINLIKDKHLKRVMKKLLLDMGLERNSERFEKAEKLFVYSINSHYAKRFGVLILKAYLDKAEIEKALVQLGKDIHKRKQAMQNEKSKIFDTYLMGMVQPYILLFCFHLSYKAFPIPDYWDFFFEKSKLFNFSIAVILSLLSMLTAIIVKKPKADI